MSILQDYERFKASISKQEWEYITAFLDSYNEYMLSDLLYSQAVYKEYEEWKTKQ
jgi:aspartate/methionine/tyrosine aminotransferase